MSEQPPQTSFPIRREHYAGIFIISLALIAYQVVLTRIFSVVLYYHFAFAGISLAMLGLTLGAEKIFQNPARFTPERFDREWAKAALGYAVSSVLLVLIFLYLPAAFNGDPAIGGALPFFLALFVIPFTYGGICVTLILTRGYDQVGKLYATDLLGAALGCMGVVFILFYVDPITIILGLSALSAFAAHKIVKGTDANTGKAKILAAVFLVATIVQGGLYLSHSSHLRVVWAKASMQENILFERWNAFSRVRVTPYGMKQSFGWGFGHPAKEGAEQKWMDIDSDAGTVLTQFDGKNTNALAFLANDVVNIGYSLRPPKKVVVIGVGGGRDILSSLYFGVEKVTGLELNPSIFEALIDKFADFTGNLQKRPDVELINTEARSWLSENDRKFDLVQISLIDTWAATAAGGLTLAENKLYTVDAWKEFIHSLNPEGLLVVARWYNAKEHRGEFYKLMALASETLKEKGIKPEDAKKHFIVYATPRIVSIALSMTPFTPQEIARMNHVAQEQGFTLLAAEDYTPDDISHTISTGAADSAYYASLPEDFSPPTDNRPFFFYMNRISNIFSEKTAGTDGNVNLENSPAIGVMFTIFVATGYCLLFFIIKPTLRLKSPMKIKELWAQSTGIAYFACIGLGFMLVEISQMQRLMILLGHPVYGLSVVLFTLLLFGGMGSATVNASQSMNNLKGRTILLFLVLILTGILTPYMTELVRHHGITMRITASVLMLAPVAFCMGMMFPIGMRLTSHVAPLQSWFWGINGAASVFGSVLGMVLSLEYGITAAFWSGVLCYVACIFLTIRLSGKHYEHVTS